MKNLLIITEEEKNRILGLHESATKNHYLINEQYKNKSPEEMMAYDLYSASRGSGTYDAGTDEISFIEIIEKINSPNQLIAINNELKKKGNFDLEGLINDEFNPQGNDDRSYLDRMKVKLSSLGAQLTYTQTINGSVKIKLPSVQTKPEDVQAGVLKNAQACGWGNDVEGYKNSGWACPKPGSGNKVDGNKGTNVKNTQTQESPNVTRIKNLQTKVGLKNTGSLDQSTLKAIMDKLSQ